MYYDAFKSLWKVALKMMKFSTNILKISHIFIYTWEMNRGKSIVSPYLLAT